MTHGSGNGHFDPSNDGEDDDRPLDATEEAAAAAEALAEADEIIHDKTQDPELRDLASAELDDLRDKHDHLLESL